MEAVPCAASCDDPRDAVASCVCFERSCAASMLVCAAPDAAAWDTADGFALPPGSECVKLFALDARQVLVKQTVFGGGLTGSVEAFARTPPSEQPAIAEVAQWVKPREFAESDAPVIGGSRGLGELTAKIIAAGGESLSPMRLAKQMPRRWLTEIHTFGGAANLIQYNVCHPAIEQLSVLTTHSRTLYYFATGTISGRKAASLAEPDSTAS